LLELARLFSHLYNSGSGVGSGKGRPYSSLLFLLSGAGHFNFQGTQKYLEDQVDSSDQSDLQETRLVVCLDSLAANSDHIYVHMSRSLKEGTMLYSFIQVRDLFTCFDKSALCSLRCVFAESESSCQNRQPRTKD
jgi:hypothetical protein